MQKTHPGFETHEEGHTKSKIGAISDPTKSNLSQQKRNNVYNHIHTWRALLEISTCVFKMFKRDIKINVLRSGYIFLSYPFNVAKTHLGLD